MASTVWNSSRDGGSEDVTHGLELIKRWGIRECDSRPGLIHGREGGCDPQPRTHPEMGDWGMWSVAWNPSRDGVSAYRGMWPVAWNPSRDGVSGNVTRGQDSSREGGCDPRPRTHPETGDWGMSSTNPTEWSSSELDWCRNTIVDFTRR